ncbi:tetratricopeptide repeat protein [Ancylostoma caninum]|uniref:Tetratricopeptide repeat protein n=1 Tax=Ancylostoma caninum TaxID=29170 RepID=A0A368GLN1_ANCCA|nr:tetratricopeptide repeat protein [Ancylostoma caninum]
MMFPGGIGGSELQQAAADKVKNDVGTFVLFGLLVEAGTCRCKFAHSGIRYYEKMVVSNKYDLVKCCVRLFVFIGAMDTDPQLARFLQQLQSETQRQKFTEQVHTLTGRCWDVCFADYRPPSKLDGKTATCLQQLQSETQRQKFTEQVHTLTGRCWDVCFADYRPPSKLDGKTATCLQNCVNRMIDASNFMVEHLQKMEGSKGMLCFHRIRLSFGSWTTHVMGNWKRLSELLHSMKSKHSGMDDMVELVEAELQLETFLEQQGEVLRPRSDYANELREAEMLLKDTVDRRSGATTLEAHLLLAKLHYASAAYSEALKDIENSGMELANTQFRTLRALRLVAEVYAIKGFCLEALESNDKGMGKMKSLFCYEKAAELAILYVGEIEKNIVGGSGKGSVTASTPTPTQKSEKLGDILECCLERVATLRVRDSAIERKSNVEGIEWYRRIITCLGDKSTGERLQQKMSRQFAELLLRAVPADGRGGAISQAVSMKTQNLSFYMGSHKGYFSPASRTEEVILLLLISEVLSTREVVLNRSADLSASRHQSVRSAKSVYNLLTLVLSTLRQYHLLSTVYERAMKFVNQDEYLWQQFALSLVCRGKWLRAARVLEQCIAAGTKDGSQANHGGELDTGMSNTAMHHMQAAVLHMEHLGQNDAAIRHAAAAVELCSEGPLSYLKGRAQLLCAIAHGRRAQYEPCFNDRRRLLAKALTMFENCVHTDPHDYLAHYYCALYHAIVRDLEAARERCARSLELNPEQPAAIMLLALIFTAEGDLKGALELVVNALKDYPTHYGLLVLQLHIETKFGRIDESLDTCSHLLDFWRKRECCIEDERVQLSLSAADGQNMLRDASSVKAGTFLHDYGVRELVPSSYPLCIFLLFGEIISFWATLAPFSYFVLAGTPSVGRELSSSTPIFANPLGIGLGTPIINPNVGSSQSGLDLAVSAVDSGVPASEAGGQSASSESGGAAGSASSALWTRFKAQANMWMALAELFLAEGRLNDVGPCVEQAVVLFPHAHQALYLKGRLFAAKADKATDETVAAKFRSEANACLLSALALCPSHTSSLFHLAKLYTSEGNIAMAEQMYRELVRVDPLCCQWWQELGSCLMRRGNVTRAMECFAAASQLDRSTPLLAFSSIPLVFPSSF